MMAVGIVCHVPLLTIPEFTDIADMLMMFAFVCHVMVLLLFYSAKLHKEVAALSPIDFLMVTMMNICMKWLAILDDKLATANHQLQECQEPFPRNPEARIP